MSHLFAKIILLFCFCIISGCSTVHKTEQLIFSKQNVCGLYIDPVLTEDYTVFKPNEQFVINKNIRFRSVYAGVSCKY